MGETGIDIQVCLIPGCLLREQAENECFQEILNKKQGGAASIIVAGSVQQQNAKCTSLFQISDVYGMSSTPEKVS